MHQLPEPAPVKVLLIEDLADHVLLVEQALRSGGAGQSFALEHVPTLKDGLSRLARGGVDVVVVDLHLPDAADLEAVRAVRAAAPGAPLVVLTAAEGDEMPLLALQAGAQDYLTKSVLVDPGPLVVRTLLMAIERVRLEAALEDARRSADKIEQRLRRERELSTAILDAEDAVVLVVDPLGRLMRHNRKAEEVLDLERDGDARPVHISDVLELLHESGSLDDLLDALAPDGSGRVVETSFRGTGGETRTIMWHASSMPLVGGSSRYTVLVGTDITESRRMEARLRERQKLEALGELTGGIAHDFNNLLSIIAVNAEMVARDLVDSGAVETDSIHEVLNATRRARALVSRLMAFARKGSEEREPVDLGALLRELVGTVRRVSPESMKVRLDLGTAPIPAVMADPVALHQAVVNLANNARDAVGGVGTIWVTMERVSVGGEETAIHPWVRPGPFVRIRVRDEGEGMDAGTRARSVEPFFTTKPVGKGTGLGLPIVYATARQHRGFVTIESAPGVGTTVDLHLPISAEVGLKSRPSHGADEAPRGGFETILLVEDEVALRRAAVKVLERFGYRVLTAERAEDALDVWRHHREEIALVISDVVMPRTGGGDLFAELRRLGCDAPFIVTSDYGAPAASPRASRLAQATTVLPNPWSVYGLAGAVRNALDRAG